MQTLGQRLRAEREKKGLSIPELARRTRIRDLLFEAIEADKPEQFPGRFFYRSFLRQYAEMLELPESVVHPEIERSIAEEQSEKAERNASQEFKPVVAPMPTGRVNVREETRRWMIRLSGLLGVLMLCSAIYFFWQRWGQSLFDESWRSVATRPAQRAPTPKYTSQPAVNPAAVTQTPTPTPGATSQPVPTSDTPTPQAANSIGPQSTFTKLTSPKVETAPPGMKPHGTIEIQASGACWVSGWRDGKQFLASTFRPGEVRIVEGGGALRLQFGSSGDVAIKVDGHAIPALGAKGESRTLEYRDGAYRLLDRTRPAAPKP